MTDNPVIPVIFRVWKDNTLGGKKGNVLALFPTIPADCGGVNCSSYELVGQHGGAYYHGCIQGTRSASAKEAQPLLEELEQIGYKLRVVQRASPAMHEERRQKVCSQEKFSERWLIMNDMTRL